MRVPAKFRPRKLEAVGGGWLTSLLGSGFNLLNKSDRNLPSATVKKIAYTKSYTVHIEHQFHSFVLVKHGTVGTGYASKPRACPACETHAEDALNPPPSMPLEQQPVGLFDSRAWQYPEFTPDWNPEDLYSCILSLDLVAHMNAQLTTEHGSQYDGKRCSG